MLKIENISKSYNKTKVLDNINFNVPDNSITGIIGPNGAGKSTLLRIIAGFENADKGQVYYNDEPLISFKLKKSLFSYMPEQLDIYPNYYVKEFLYFIHKTIGFQNKELLEALQLLNVKDKKICELSKGYRQRIKFYFALCNKKRFVILDEPFDGFDPIQLLGILNLIKKENLNNRNFLLSIHQLYDAEKICNYYVLLESGKVVTEGKMENLKEIYGHENSSLEKIFMKALQQTCCIVP